MNRGNYIGWGVAIFAFIFAYVFIGFGSIVPELSIAFIGFGVLCYTGGIAIIVYSTIFEGNAYLRRRFGQENIGLGILIEQGAFWKFFQISMSESSVTLEKEVFIIIPKHIGFRRGGGVPYVCFMKGTGQSVDLAKLEPSLNSKLNTAWLMEESAIARSLAVNQLQNKLMLLAAAGFAAILIVLILYIVGVGMPAKDIAQKTLDVVVQLPKLTPTPSIGAIGNA